MGGGEGARRRAMLRRAQERQARKKAEKAAMKQGLRAAPGFPLKIPQIKEDDLIAFQLSHFDDDCNPDAWFVDAETALGYDPADDDDGLGYYEDGVKRTLTDEQIELFRHTEVEQLLRQNKAARNDHVEIPDKTEDKDEVPGNEARAESPNSDASSMEGDLVGLAKPDTLAALSSIQKEKALENLIDAAYYTDAKGRQKPQAAAYDERHKRKWEQYIEEIDPNEGSLTHRRILRELDDTHEENVELDY